MVNLRDGPLLELRRRRRRRAQAVAVRLGPRLEPADGLPAREPGVAHGLEERPALRMPLLLRLLHRGAHGVLDHLQVLDRGRHV